MERTCRTGNPGDELQGRTPVRVKIKRLEQKCKGKERVVPYKRKKVQDPSTRQQRIHKFFSKLSKAEAGSSRANSQDNQGATCGPLEGVSG